MNWLEWTIRIVVLVAFGAIVGTITLKLFRQDAEKWTGRVLLLGVVGVFVGHALFLTLFHKGLVPVFGSIPQSEVQAAANGSMVSTTGYPFGLEPAHIIWDLLIGVVGSFLVTIMVLFIRVISNLLVKPLDKGKG